MHPRTWRGRRRRAALAGRSLEEADATLLAAIDGAFRAVARRAGPRLACGPGCSACCHGPFPIDALDAWRLGRGIADLDRRDPLRAARIRERAHAAVGRLGEGFPGDPGSGRLDAAAEALDRFVAGHAGLACPVLDPGTGTCELYEARPMACRTYGPPLRFGAERADPCGLCFQGADPAQIEACRLEPDLDLEAAVIQRLGRPPGDEYETLIAYALVRPLSDAVRGGQP